LQLGAFEVRPRFFNTFRHAAVAQVPRALALLAAERERERPGEELTAAPGSLPL
jgi:hypothetical protein